MHSTTLVKLSRQGNASAITTLINRVLQVNGVKAKAKISGTHLKVLLESSRIPDRYQLVPVVAANLSRLELCSSGKIDKVYVYGRQTGCRTYAWVEAIEPPVAPPVSSSAAPNPVARPLYNRPFVASTQTLEAVTSAPSQDVTSRSALEEHWLGQIQTALSRRLAASESTHALGLSDIEVEGADVLITFETRQRLDERALAEAVRQALQEVNIEIIRVARLYQRHPRTQLSLPIREIVLSAAIAPPPAPLPKADGADSCVASLTEAAMARRTPPQGRLSRKTQLGLAGVGGLLGAVSVAKLLSPIAAVGVLLCALALWRLFHKLLKQ